MLASMWWHYTTNIAILLMIYMMSRIKSDIKVNKILRKSIRCVLKQF